MGIQGLLPFLKQIHQPVNISDFKGCTVAVDAYCWLHKGAFSCAEKLAMGEKTEQYVYYCMKYVDNLLRKGLKPILVFDGCHLKSKEDVEKTRRGRRELNKKKAAQFLREGKRNEAKECLQKCVDITPQMALNLMNVCRDRGVDCIVAPYEADAQLAHLSCSGVAQLVVTEDSDLLLFGCEKVIFKMDFYGNGILIEKSRLNEVLAIQNSFYSFEKFRYMCILSGCDYLPSLPGIGLVKACKVLKIARQQDLRQLLKKLPTYLKMNLAVTDEYVEKFICADNTFLYQLVFDPLQRKMIPLSPYPPEVDPSGLDYAGQYMPQEQAYQIALGNVDIHTHKHMAFFDPRTFKPKINEKPQYRHQLSIWDPEYRIKTSGSPCKTIQTKASGDCQFTSSQGKARTVRVDIPRQSPISVVTGDFGHEEDFVMQEPGKIPKAAERLLLSQYVEGTSGDGDGGDGFSQKENLLEDNVAEQYKDESMKAVGSPRKGKKRKTPSWLEETAIIEESVKKTIVDTTQCEQLEPFPVSKKDMEPLPDKDIDPFPVPNKGRNVFAVSPGKKNARFDLEVHALRVKSRYFGTSCTNPGKTKSPMPALNSKDVSPLAVNSSKVSDSSMTRTSPSPKNHLLTMFENAPTRLKTEKNKLDENLGASVSNKKSCLISPKQQLLSMFERAPVKLKSERDEHGCLSRKKTPKAGLFKYFQPKLADAEKTLSSNIDVESCNLKIKTSPIFSNSNPHTNSVKSVRPSNMKSRLSAFSWSKSGPLTRHVARQSPVSHKLTGNVSLPVEIDWELCTDREPQVKSAGSLDCEEVTVDRDSEKSTDSGISDTSDNIQSPPCEGQENTLSETRGRSDCKRPQNVNEERGLSKAKGASQMSDKDSERIDTDTGDDLIELESYSYSEFLQGLRDSERTEESSQSSIPAVSGVDQVSSIQSTTPGVSGLDQANKGLAGTAGPSNSQRSSLASIDSFCLDSSQTVVDLTDPDIDLDLGSQSSQKSQVSAGSRSSQGSAWSKGCRISGLSRLSKTKVKAGVKRSATQPPAGQPSITDMISKYW